jgi:two-component system, chemotaxis family, sensor kinase CheA
MSDIAELTQRLASGVVMADPTDLPALAEIHEQFRRVAKLAREAGTAAGVSLSDAATAGEKLIETVILREVDDVEGVLARVSETVQLLQRLMAGGEQQPAGDSASAAVRPMASQAAAIKPPSGEASPEAAIPAVVQDEEAAPNPEDVPMVLEFVSEATEHIETAEAAVLKIEENPTDLEAVNGVFRCFHTIKGVAGFLNLKRIGKLAHAAENLLDLARHGSLRLEGAAVDVVLEAIDAIKHMIGALKVAASEGKAPASEPGLPDLLQRLAAAAAGQTIKANDAPAVATEQAPAEEAKPAASSPAGETARSAGGTTTGSSGEATVKVATDRLDALINMVGELVIAQSMVSQDMLVTARGNQRIERNVGHLSKITRELQDLSMSMRMVPIHGVFQKMSRLVRDLARKNGKEIELVLTGSETELDRNVVEAISDPLVHMVRNAADHGIESPEDRVAADKPRQGRLELRARHQAGNIVIEISDDGRGLNKAKILKKAMAAGIVREQENLSDQDVFKLIFAPGLSTAEKVTDVSGRGVGMDVVKRNVEALRGRVDIVSEEGRGSTFTIRLPLTLAVIDGQIVRVGEHRYIVPITSIEQSIQPRSEQLSTVQGRGELCMVRGDLLPIFRLHRLFGIKPKTEDPTKSLVVIVQNDTQRCCLLVDELLGQQQVVIKTLGDSLGQVAGISGGAILGDGNVSLILDVPGLIAMSTER